MTSLKETYTLRRDKILVPLAARIEDHLKNLLGPFARIDRISARAKALAAFPFSSFHFPFSMPCSREYSGSNPGS